MTEKDVKTEGSEIRNAAGFEGGGRDYGLRNAGGPPGAGEGKGTNSPLEPPERGPDVTLILALWDPYQTSDLQNFKIISLLI